MAAVPVPLDPGEGRARLSLVGGRRTGAEPGAGSVSLDEAVARSTPTALAGEQTLPVLPALSPLFPAGALGRGTTVRIDGVGAASLAWAVAAGPSRHGSWVATVGLPSLGLASAAEMGVCFERLAVIAEPPPPQWSSVVASLVGAFDVVLVAALRSVRAADARRLAARARERGTALVVVDLAHALAGRAEGSSGSGRSRERGLEVDLALRVTEAAWHGVGDGHGHLTHRRVEVEASGRRAAARPRRADLLLPGPGGQVVAVDVDPAAADHPAAAVPHPAADHPAAAVPRPAADYPAADVPRLGAAG